MKIANILIFSIILVLIAICLVFLIPKSSERSGTMVDIMNIDRTLVGEEQIAFVLYSLEANKLHNPPLSKNTPKIEFIIGDEIYSSEIVNGKLKIIKSRIEDPDLRISMSRQEFINALSSNPKLYLQSSVEEGETKIEVIAGKTELLAKGYFSLYKKITGKDLTGSILKYIKE